MQRDGFHFPKLNCSQGLMGRGGGPRGGLYYATRACGGGGGGPGWHKLTTPPPSRRGKIMGGVHDDIKSLVLPSLLVDPRFGQTGVCMLEIRCALQQPANLAPPSTYSTYSTYSTSSPLPPPSPRGILAREIEIVQEKQRKM